MSQQTVMVTGLHCQSCVRVDTAAELSVEQVRAALADEGGYTVVS